MDIINSDYCMVGECVRFLCTSCERFESPQRTSEFSNLSQQVHDKNRTNEPMQLFVYAIHIEIILTLEVCQRRTISNHSYRLFLRVFFA